MPDFRGPSSSRTLSARSQWLVVAVAALATMALLGGHLLLTGLTGHRALAEPARPRAHPDVFTPTRLQWSSLKLAPIRTLSFVPLVRAEGEIAIDGDRATPVFSPYTGRVVKIFAKAGQFVEKGAPLMAVEATEIVKGEDDLIAAVMTLGTARAQLTLAETAQRREHALYLAKGAALKDWQQSEAALTAAQNKFRVAEIGLAAARNRLAILGRTDAEIAALEHAPTARLNPVAEIRAPISGTVIERQVGLGQFIESGASKPVYTIGDLSTVWLVAKVREADAGRVHLGEKVRVRVLAYPGRVFRAKVSWIAPSIDPKTHRLPVRADVENKGGALKPVMFARFAIATGPARKAPAVPEEAVIHRGRSERVWVVGPKGSLAARTIKTGESRGRMFEVLSGLKPGDRVVTAGSIFIDRAARGG